MLFAGYSVLAKLLFDETPKGFTALILVMTFLSGMNLLFLGLLGEYLGRVYEEVKRRPVYVVDQVTRGPEVTAEDRAASRPEPVA
jgi:hypothetical protein